MSDKELDKIVQDINKRKREQTNEKKVADLLESILAHPEISKSIPPFDLQFVSELCREFGVEKVRNALNKIHIWIMIGNRRENYRATLFSWLQRENK